MTLQITDYWFILNRESKIWSPAFWTVHCRKGWDEAANLGWQYPHLLEGKRLSSLLEGFWGTPSPVISNHPLSLTWEAYYRSCLHCSRWWDPEGEPSWPGIHPEEHHPHQGGLAPTLLIFLKSLKTWFCCQAWGSHGNGDPMKWLYCMQDLESTLLWFWLCF